MNESDRRNSLRGTRVVPTRDRSGARSTGAGENDDERSNVGADQEIVEAAADGDLGDRRLSDHERSGRTEKREPGPQALDGVLVERALGGDQGAFEQLVVRYEARIRRLAFSFVRDEGLAEDIAQDSFVQAMRKLRTLHRAGSFRSWLFSITVNRARDEIRRRARFVDLSDEGRGDLESGPWAVHEPDPARELRPYLARAIAALPSRYRAPLLLKEIEGLTYAEIGEVLGIPIGTAQIRIHRARLRLRKQLQELGVEAVKL